MLDAVAQDVRYVLRWLRRSPGFAAVAVLSLGIGIGFNASIFAVVDALLLRPLPVREPASLVDIYTSGADGDTYSSNSLPDILDYRAQTPAFADIAAYSPMFAGVTRGDRSRLVLGEIVTGNYFRMLGLSARLGRTLLPEDDVPAAPRAIVLSNRYWQREFGADPAAIGSTLRIRGESFTIVGVLDDAFTGMLPLLAPEIWVAARYVEEIEPFGINESVPSPTGTSRLDRRGQRWMFAKARLAPGATVDQARANVEVVAARLRAAYPQTNKDRRMSVRRSTETRLHPEADRALTWIVTGTMAAVGLVLIIACANVAGMLLARASARQREIAIRIAVGAGRRRLVQQLLTEGLVLGLLGAGVGAALAIWLTRLLTTFELPIPIALSLDLRLDARVLGFMLLVAAVTGILAGVAPALRSTRPNLVTDLRGAKIGRRLAGRRWTGRDALVVVQMAVTVVLLVVAGLLLRSLQAASLADVGFPADGLAMVSADTEMLRYTPERSRNYWDTVVRRVQALPGVKSVAIASRLPFSLNFNRTNIAVPGRQRTPDEMGPSINSAIVSPDYFTTIGVDVLRGRTFTDADTPERPALAVVSETMAKTYWPGEDAIGRTVFERTLDSGRTFQIIGIVADHKLQSVSEAPQPAIYFAKTQRPSGFNVLVARTAGDDVALVAEMRRLLVGLEPNLLIMESQTMRAQMQAMLFPVRVAAALVAVFSGLAMLLAAVGLYGIVAVTVAERTREIGIRMAIGAQPSAVLGLVLRQGFGLAAVGLVVGFGLGALATRVVANALYGIGAADPIAWGVAAVALATVTLLAHAVPAYRAMHIDPVRCLRTE